MSTTDTTVTPRLLGVVALAFWLGATIDAAIWVAFGQPWPFVPTATIGALVGACIALASDTARQRGVV